MNKTWVVDLDDTLVECQYYYNVPLVNFMNFILNKFGYAMPQVEDVLLQRRNLSRELLSHLGYSMGRFPRSFEMALEKIAKAVKEKTGIVVKITDDDKQQVRDIACMAFTPKPMIIKGAIEVLDYLRSQGDTLILYSKGEPELQKAKLENNDLTKWFDKIIITPDKNRETLTEKIGKPTPETYVVGDSMDSDVIPGLKAGLNVIYVPSVTEAYSKVPEWVEQHPKFREVKGIKKIIEIYDEL